MFYQQNKHHRLLRRTVPSTQHPICSRCLWTSGHVTCCQPISKRAEMHVGPSSTLIQLQHEYDNLVCNDYIWHNDNCCQPLLHCGCLEVTQRWRLPHPSTWVNRFHCDLHNLLLLLLSVSKKIAEWRHMTEKAIIIVVIITVIITFPLRAILGFNLF